LPPDFDDHENTRNEGGHVPMLRKAKFASAALAVLATLAAGTALADQGEDAEQVEAIFSTTSNGYVRLLRPDGSFQPETYKFGKGEFWGGDFADASIDHMTVDDVARTVAPALARQSYVFSKDPNSAELYIVINWGTTVAPEYRTLEPAFEKIVASQMMAIDPPGDHGGVKASRVSGDTKDLDATLSGLEEMETNGSANTWNVAGLPSAIDLGTAASGRTTLGDTVNPPLGAGAQLRAEGQTWAQTERRNAQMLGYSRFNDAELQKYRYFVVLLAYDNKTVSQKKPKLLWEARLSISQHRNLFDKRLGALAENASAFFGQDSNGLVYKAVPVGFVHIGQIRSLEFPTASDAAAVAGDGAHMAYFVRKGPDSGLVVVDVDRPEGVIVTRIPASETPARVVWSDSTHVRVTLASAEALAFDTSARSWSAAPTDTGAAVQGAVPRPDDMQARVEGKFPHRTVAILGSDKAGRRFLLAVSGAKGAARYYIFDSQDEILVDVGRSSRTP
jgi:hypothetical protein